MFDPVRFSRETGVACDPATSLEKVRRTREGSSGEPASLVDLRAALLQIFEASQFGQSISGADAWEIDWILDQIHSAISGGKRVTESVPDLVKGIGIDDVFPIGHQYRFELPIHDEISRGELYDRVAGVLARNLAAAPWGLGGLYLYPPAYSWESGDGPFHIAMFWIIALDPARAGSDEALEESLRLARAVTTELGS